MIHAERLLILDFGSQYTQLIARRVRSLKVYCEIHPCTMPLEAIRAYGAKGIVLSGGPASVEAPGAPLVDRALFELGVPVLGICYGQQLMAKLLGGKVAKSTVREFGPARLDVLESVGPFASFPVGDQVDVWMSHCDRVDELPPGFKPLARTPAGPYGGIGDPSRRLYAVQFHPEVVHTPLGSRMLESFLGECEFSRDWNMGSVVASSIREISGTTAGERVICGLSGGVDSAVAAMLIHRAIGDRLRCIFVDNGLLRKGEREDVESMFSNRFHVPLTTIDASERFLTALEGVADPEKKRKIIGRTFIEVFEEAVTRDAAEHGDPKFLAQGTLYPDVIESVSFKGPSAVIKSHHNVGGLPERMKLKLVEPLRELFKDEVRELGRELGLPEKIVGRQPFPGPGLSIRLLGAISKDRLNVLREADAIVREDVERAGLSNEVWQGFAVLLPVKTVGVNRVVYDVTSKPPGTIEWE
jgi:GMP synthase (glutamine-hydrolysing)